MIYLISEANRFIGRLDEITDMLISLNYFVYMYARKEATLSSQIEGTQATFSDLIKAEAGMGDEAPNDVKEIENYIKALNYVRIFAVIIKIDKRNKWHFIGGVRGENKTPGEFRNTQN